jgi:ribosomal protein S18 acetylase RimI-like enzyme
VFPDPQRERWHERLADPKLSMLVAEGESDPRGTRIRAHSAEPSASSRARAGCLRPSGLLLGFTACGDSRDPGAGPGTGEIMTLFVAAGRWRAGVGRALMAAALADLAARGHTEATVWSFAANQRANAFYEAHGFTRDGAERTEAAWAHLVEVRYRRPLP